MTNSFELHVFAAVLFSAIFQAGWNFLTKKSRADKIALLAVGWFFLGLAMVPFAFWFHEDGAFSWDWPRYMLLSGFIHAFYVCLLGWAYEVGEISVVYPVARGMGIVGTAVGSVAIGLHGISGYGLIGISGVVGGVLLIGLGEVPHRARRKAFVVALLVALAVSAYSIVDSIGARKVPLVPYLAAMNILAPVFASPFLLWRMRPQLRAVLRDHKWEAFLVSFAGLIAYTIVLWAYRRAPTAYVATLREFSVVIASLLGVVVLRENLSRRKALGIFVIVAGIVCLKLA